MALYHLWLIRQQLFPGLPASEASSGQPLVGFLCAQEPEALGGAGTHLLSFLRDGRGFRTAPLPHASSVESPMLTYGAAPPLEPKLARPNHMAPHHSLSPGMGIH
jgi:hypothetical protein